MVNHTILLCVRYQNKRFLNWKNFSFQLSLSLKPLCTTAQRWCFWARLCDSFAQADFFTFPFFATRVGWLVDSTTTPPHRCCCFTAVLQMILSSSASFYHMLQWILLTATRRWILQQCGSLALCVAFAGGFFLLLLRCWVFFFNSNQLVARPTSAIPVRLPHKLESCVNLNTLCTDWITLQIDPN